MKVHLSDYFRFPEPYTDGITSKVEIHLDWKDRLRLLVCGVIHVDTFTMVEHTPGRMNSESTVQVLGVRRWFRQLRRKPQAFEVVEERKAS